MLTTTFVTIRSAEHMVIFDSTEKHIKNATESPISNYLLQCGCFISFNHFDILASDTYKTRLLIKKALANMRNHFWFEHQVIFLETNRVK